MIEELVKNSAKKYYESSFASGELSFNVAMSFIEKFFNEINKKDGQEKFLIFPEIFNWQNNDDSSDSDIKEFQDYKKACEFLRGNVLYGRDNYHILKKEEWHLLICHERDLHFYGSESDVEKFKQLCI
jgi:hypothetical protein